MIEKLPTSRAFLLRISSEAQPATGIHRGRIEHIRSGRTTQFTSMDKVTDFVDEILAEEEITAEQGITKPDAD